MPEVRICKKCSGIKPGDLKGIVKKKDRRCGCFGACAKKHPELKGKCYVRVGKRLVVADSKKELLATLAEGL
ncbi:hypothetical protein [Collinsella sp. An2]|uniref:hypothetical protein n=1 Tax=Collinsella sp. An2 TaxID=1965585 RepID=UPI000B37B537|nr:hypothetical protein [Collinsella sp. An2]OUP09810.1 hypothetical protein B5F33_04280 [Collinsella sp. An2]